MPRICITFHQEMLHQLHMKAKHKKITVSQYIRELIEIGLKIEEMAEQKEVNGSSKMKETEMPDELKLLWKNSLRC